MNEKNVRLEFSNTFAGTLIAPRGQVDIGVTEGTLAPYDLLFGALAGCLYSTFLDVAMKKRIQYDRVEMVVTGEKRTEVPTTLKWVHIEAFVHNAEKELGLEQAFELAAKYCSIYETLSKVAEMTYKVRFSYDGK